MRTRTEHLEFCKRRAREYLQRGDVANAITSMFSDLEKHEETRGVNPFIMWLGLKAAMDNDRDAAKRIIEGFH